MSVLTDMMQGMPPIQVDMSPEMKATVTAFINTVAALTESIDNLTTEMKNERRGTGTGQPQRNTPIGDLAGGRG